MEQDSNNSNKNWALWKPVVVFYVKTTSWIIIPLILAVFLGKYVSESIGSQFIFFICLMIGFGITCFGIYREINQYKKDLKIKKNDK
ncbi:MAG: hypothetical protein WCO07_00195 [bacterium]